MELKVETKYNIGDRVFTVIGSTVFSGEITGVEIHCLEKTQNNQRVPNARYTLKGHFTWVRGTTRYGSDTTYVDESGLYCTEAEAMSAREKDQITSLNQTVHNTISEINIGIRNLKLKDMPSAEAKVMLKGLIEAKKLLISTKRETT